MKKIFLLFVLVSNILLSQHKPNVIVIIADDLGYADMSFLEHAPKDVKKFGTPGFDKLAKTGTYFKNAYASAPICSPSRAGLITGRYQHRWGNYSYGEGGLPLNEFTIPEALLEAGYKTSKYGKTHLNGGPKKYPSQHGFEEFLGFMFHTWDYTRLSQKDLDAVESREGYEGYIGNQVVGPLLKATVINQAPKTYEKISYEDAFTTKIFTDEAVNYIEENKGEGKPFYLHVAYNAVHMPTYVTDKIWAEKVGAPYVKWDREAKEWGFPYWEPNNETHKVFHKKWGHLEAVDKNGRRSYLSHLLALDYGVCKILEALEETGQREHTIIFFVSDNGGTINTYSNNTPLNGYKYMLAEGGNRIPFLVSMPGTLPQGIVNSEAVISTLDIFPTILDLVKTKAPKNLDGKSLLPVLKGKKKEQHKYLVWAINPDTWAVRMGKWKLTNNAGWQHKNYTLLDNGDAVRDSTDFVYPNELHLYNLEEDISETTNLVALYPKIVKKMQHLYKEWNAQMPGPLNQFGGPKKPKKK